MPHGNAWRIPKPTCDNLHRPQVDRKFAGAVGLFHLHGKVDRAFVYNNRQAASEQSRLDVLGIESDGRCDVEAPTAALSFFQRRRPLEVSQ